MSLSFVHGLDTEPLRFETIGQALDEVQSGRGVVTCSGPLVGSSTGERVPWTKP